MKRLLCLAIALAACGDDGSPSGVVDAHVDSRPPVDSATDGPTIDTLPIDAAPDAMLTPAESIMSVRAATDGTVALDVVGVTVTYIKPQIGSLTNDPAGFTVQATQDGPALFVSVDPTTLTSLTPALAVGDVIAFTVTTKATTGAQPRATAISDVTRTATATDVNPLAKNVSASTDLVTAVDNYDSELVSFSGTVGSAFTSSGSMWVKASITTAGITVIDPNFQLRLPATLQAAKQIDNGCTFTVTNTPVGRFTSGVNSQTQLTAIVTGDIVVNTCPAPTVTMAVATDATTVKVTFSRPLDTTTVDMSKFTIADAASAPLGVTAAVLAADKLSVTLTTAAQTPATVYTVTVANTVADTFGTALGTPATATFTGFMPAVAANHLVINEIDYDNDGTDSNEFIEIYNPTAAAISVANMQIVLVNGNTTATPALYSTHATYDLTTVDTLASHQYLVIGSSTLIAGLDTTTPDPDIKTLALAVAADNIQNGARDAVFLVEKGNMAMSIAPTVVDSITYAGNTTGNLTYTVGGQMITFAPEGTSSASVDASTGNGSICRAPNAVDTDNNSNDIKFCSMQTPGADNTL
ncbi:MAG TPA: lamin tail domain-containing protein [Kofleriaceae bacterium]